MLQVGPLKPSSDEVRLRSIGKPVPVIAQAPSGLRFVLSNAAFRRASVPLELLDDGEQVVGDGARLRPLRVRVDREDRLAMTVDEIQQRPPQREGARKQAEHQLALPHAVHRHVDVVARARRMKPPRHVVAAPLDHQTLDVEEKIFVGAVVGDAANLVLRHAVERFPQGVRVGGGHDPLRGEHDEVRVVDRHHRREQESLGVFEILVEDVGDVFRRKLHQWKYIEFVARLLCRSARQKHLTERRRRGHDQRRPFVHRLPL